MPGKPERDSKSPEKQDAATKALERERAVAGEEVPVKQHNPDHKGLNPDQRGPAQPAGTD